MRPDQIPARRPTMCTMCTGAAGEVSGLAGGHCADGRPQLCDDRPGGEGALSTCLHREPLSHFSFVPASGVQSVFVVESQMISSVCAVPLCGAQGAAQQQCRHRQPAARHCMCGRRQHQTYSPDRAAPGDSRSGGFLTAPGSVVRRSINRLGVTKPTGMSTTKCTTSVVTTPQCAH